MTKRRETQCVLRNTKAQHLNEDRGASHIKFSDQILATAQVRNPGLTLGNLKLDLQIRPTSWKEWKMQKKCSRHPIFVSSGTERFAWVPASSTQDIATQFRCDSSYVQHSSRTTKGKQREILLRVTVATMLFHLLRLNSSDTKKLPTEVKRRNGKTQKGWNLMLGLTSIKSQSGRQVFVEKYLQRLRKHKRPCIGSCVEEILAINTFFWLFAREC